MKTMLLRSALLLVLVGATTGCVRHYWYKAGGTPEQFVADNQGCVQQAATNLPPGAGEDAVEAFYRACLQSRGYLRERTQEAPPPPGFFRGIEDNDALRAAVQQAATAQPPRASFEQQLAQLDDLKARGRITDEEYAALRKRLVEGAAPAALAPPPPPPPPPPPSVAALPSLAGRWYGRGGGILDIRTAGGPQVEWEWEHSGTHSSVRASGTGTVAGGQVTLTGYAVGSGPTGRFSLTLTQEGEVLRGVVQGPSGAPTNVELRRERP